MAKSKDKIIEELLEHIKSLQESVEDNTASTDLEIAKIEKQHKKEREAERQRLAALTKNSLELVGFNTSIFSLRGIMRGLADSNSDLMATLAQTNRVSTANAVLHSKSINDTGAGLSQAIRVLQNVTEAGIRGATQASYRLIAQFGVLGGSTQSLVLLMRRQSALFGMSTLATRDLAEATISTAVENRVGVDAMVEAMNELSSSLLRATVTFGRETAVSFQKLSARLLATLGQEFKDPINKFISSFLEGSQGMLRAIALRLPTGRMFGGTESGAEAGIMAAIRSIANLRTQAGTGVEAPFVLDAIKRQFNLSDEHFAVVDALMRENGGSLVNLEERMLEALNEQQRLLDPVIQMRDVLRQIRAVMIPIITSVGKVLTSIFGWIKKIGGQTVSTGFAILAALVALRGFIAVSQGETRSGATNRLINELRMSRKLQLEDSIMSQKLDPPIRSKRIDDLAQVYNSHSGWRMLLNPISTIRELLSRTNNPAPFMQQGAPRPGGVPPRHWFSKIPGIPDPFRPPVSPDVVMDYPMLQGQLKRSRETNSAWMRRIFNQGKTSSSLFHKILRGFMMPFAFLGKIYTSVFSLLTVTGRAAIFNKAAKMKDWAFDSAKLFASWTIAHITAAAGAVMSAGVTEVILGVATVGAAAWGISKLLESDGEEEKADRKVALRLQEESLELQRAKEAKNESLNPLWKISNDIAQNVAMMNSLVDLAETRTDIAETQSAGLQFGNASPSMLGG